MAESYQIPEWMKSELGEDALAKLLAVAGEKRAEAVVSPAHALKAKVDELVHSIKTTGTAGDAAEFDAAVRAFRSVVYPTAAAAPRAARATAASANGTATTRDSKREVGVWKFSTEVVRQAGYDGITAARHAGFDHKGLRKQVESDYDSGQIPAEGSPERTSKVEQYAVQFAGVAPAPEPAIA